MVINVTKMIRKKVKQQGHVKCQRNFSNEQLFITLIYIREIKQADV